MAQVPIAELNVLTAEERDYLRSIVDEIGLPAATRELGLSRSVVTSALAGLDVRRGSLELIRDALTRRKAVTK
ncbi:MAG: hypothetical protein V4550_18370 [Gemmatimonadota bacterium]